MIASKKRDGKKLVSPKLGLNLHKELVENNNSPIFSLGMHPISILNKSIVVMARTVAKMVSVPRGYHPVVTQK